MKWSSVFILCLVTAMCVPALAGEAQPSHKELKKASKRAKIDEMAAESIKELMSKSKKARVLHNKSYGYAVFDNLKFAFGLSGGGGVGVARNRDTGEKTYMKMGTAGLSLGIGGQKYQVIFLFQDKMTFDNFVNKGWEAGGNANAVAGPVGVNAPATFTNGLAVYQITEGGLMLQADIAGTKYWKYKKLNQGS
ncbi:MAG: YSC84-related protein [Actinobacteria bacterium]|nr:YSC84-related protein [Actinomycetota bacterium]MCZ6777475.1 YSC84-related protein [Acidobacteriota bacterium]